MTVWRPDPDHPLAERYAVPGGPWDTPALDEVLSAGGRRTDAARTDDARSLVVDGDERLGAEDLEVVVAEVAGGLRSLGVGAGDVVAWQLPTGAASLVLYRACWRLGAVAAPVHHRASLQEVQALATRIGPALTVTGRGMPAQALDEGPTVIDTGGAASLRAALHGPPVPRAEVEVDPASVAVVLFTSGATGRPKGVLHTHRALAGKARTMVDVHGLSTEDVVLMPAPLAHVSGLLNGVLLPGVLPMKVVLLSRWDPTHALDLIEAEHVSFMVGPPTFFLGLLDAPSWSPQRTASLRLVSCGGASVTPAFAEDAAHRLGATVKRSYGSTEAPTVTTSTAGDPAEVGWTTDGGPVGEAEVRIEPTTGEVEVRGPEVLAGYLDPEDEADAFAAGRWFRTGDRGDLDSHGRLVVTGRLRDVIIRGGENVDASEVEAVLEAHPAVHQAVAVGEPDERLGERVVAFVVLRAPFDLDACRAWFADQGVTRFKTPERLEVLDELPVLAAGKPDRRALEARLRR